MLLESESPAVSYDTQGGKLDRTIHKPTLQMYPELQRAFDRFNVELFDGELPNTLLTLQRQSHTNGYFRPKAFVSADGETFTHEIALNPDHFSDGSIEVLSTLVHEMVHLWQQEVGSPGRGRYHNKEWAAKMRDVGLTPAGGEGLSHDIGDHVSHRIVPGGPFEQIAKGDLSFDLRWFIPKPVVVVAPPIAPIELPDPDHPDLPDDPELRDLLGMPPKPKNKIAYQCPVCGSKVWGKPGLEDRLWCSLDNQAFMPLA